MTKFLPRSITFTIPAKLGVGVQVTAVENADGNFEDSVDVLGTAKHAADLRGLFFHLADESDLAGLKIIGGDGLITGTQIKANGVINLGNGNNLHGAANPFDVGIAFGTAGKGRTSSRVRFTSRSTPRAPLTLDDISHVLFGARLTFSDALSSSRRQRRTQLTIRSIRQRQLMKIRKSSSRCSPTTQTQTATSSRSQGSI